MTDQQQPIENQPDPPEGEQGSAIVRSLATVTRQIPALTPRPATSQSRAAREQIAALVVALGDPNHALHPQAVDDLVALGDQAVPMLCEALNPRRPWLVSFRAAEALGQIGDGRATGPLIEALQHPNGNVRWGAVSALAQIGDARALLELRRVARDDRGKTSWGESVAGAAQSAVDAMRSQNVIFRSADLLKTAVACVLMLVGLILAYSVYTMLRDELGRVGHETVQVEFGPLVRTAVPTTQRAPTAAPLPTATPAASVAGGTGGTAVAATGAITGTVLTTGNVRDLPSRESGKRIGIVAVGDEVVFLASSPDLQWYKVRLGTRRTGGSQISGDDGSGWVISTVVSLPATTVPIETIDTPPASPQPTP